jgi:alpha-glucosidase
VQISSSAPWWQHAVCYQIYIRSFADGDGNGIGDLRGIEKRLPYLADLGVDAVWVTPFYPSPQHDHGYDVSDYRDVDPLFGTLEDFDAMLARAHDLGIRVIVDVVPNHTSSEHPWFRESRSSRTNPKRDWYIWEDPAPNGGPPTNWLSRFGGSAWEWEPRREQYYCHVFLPSQPALNWRSAEVRTALTDVLRFWLSRRLDGFRIDAAAVLSIEAPPRWVRSSSSVRTRVCSWRSSDVAPQSGISSMLRGSSRGCAFMS